MEVLKCLYPSLWKIAGYKEGTQQVLQGRGREGGEKDGKISVQYLEKSEKFTAAGSLSDDREML